MKINTKSVPWKCTRMRLSTAGGIYSASPNLLLEGRKEREEDDGEGKDASHLLVFTPTYESCIKGPTKAISI